MNLTAKAERFTAKGENVRTRQAKSFFSISSLRRAITAAIFRSGDVGVFFVVRRSVRYVCTHETPVTLVVGFLQVKIQRDGRIHALTVGDVKLSEAGQVRLTAKDFQTRAQLIVRGKLPAAGSAVLFALGAHVRRAPAEPPVAFTKPLEDQTVEEEATATLECEVSRENALVQWFKEGQEIHKSKKYDTIVDGRKRALTIHDCNLEDIKTYTCDAKDSKTSCFLDVIRKSPCAIWRMASASLALRDVTLQLEPVACHAATPCRRAHRAPVFRDTIHPVIHVVCRACNLGETTPLSPKCRRPPNYVAVRTARPSGPLRHGAVTVLACRNCRGVKNTIGIKNTS